MIKTEQDFRDYMKGKTIPFNLLLGLKSLSDEMEEAERTIFENCKFQKYSEEKFEKTHNLMLAVVARNIYIIMMTFVRYLGIPENEIDMHIDPKITYDRKTGSITVDRGRPEWLDILNNWSVCFDPPNTELKTLSDEESNAIAEEAKERSKQHINDVAAKTLNEAELKRRIFNMVM